MKTSTQNRFVVLIATFVLLMPALVHAQASNAKEPDDPVDVSLYRTKTFDSSDLYALDPWTLSDLSAKPAAIFDDMFDPSTVIFSQDGSTLAAATPGGSEIVIQHGVNGSIIFAFSSEGTAWPQWLSADGSKVVA
jgi:hypothetical protein